jgi:phenylpropionate dioxygenase-like ring-hydroxylating dioxygenase large terminal subunit
MNTTKTNGVRTMDDAFAAMLAADSHPENITDALRRNAPLGPGPSLIPVERYIDRRFHELEKEKLWSKVWQVAAHEDDFPNVGDVVPYDITTMSFLVVRTSENEYKAYYNACLHRGRKLRENRAKSLDELRCPFHGWSWNLDGSLKQVPCAYDFAGMNRDEESLPEVQVGRWGRFIFINPDPQAAPLEDHLGDLASHFEVLPYDRRFKQAHVAKVIKANWKVVQDAFMESYHVLMTHPQILTGGANDLCTKYDAFGNYSRAIRCGALETEGLPSWESVDTENGMTCLRHPLNGWLYEHVGDGVVQVTTPKGKSGKFTANADWIEGELTDANPHMCLWAGGRQLLPGGPAPRPRDLAIPDDMKAAMADAPPRVIQAELQRRMLKDVIPSVADTIPDVELHSSMYFTVFPNWHPWGSFNLINYRFRPNGDNHEECIMECMYLAPIPENGEYEPASEIHWLEPDEDWTNAPELGMLTKIFNQDLRNLPYVFQGMKATARKHLRIGDYNELKLRHFHQLYGKWVEDEEVVQVGEG